MPVDLVFELSYLLSERLGCDVRAKSYSFEPREGLLCVELEHPKGRACAYVKQCKNLGTPRLERCISKALVNDERIVEELASQLPRCG